MAVAKVGTTQILEVPTTGTSFTSASLTLNGSADCALVRFAYSATSGIPSVVNWNGVAMTLVGTRPQDGDGHEVGIWRLVAPGTGSHTVTMTLSHDTGGVLSLDGYSGVDQTTPTAGYISGASTAASPATMNTSASAVAGDLVIDALSCTWNAAMTDDASPSVQDVNQGETVIGYCKLAGSNETGTGTVTCSWTFTGTQSTARCAVILKAAAAGGATVLKRNSLLAGLGASGGFFQNPLNAPYARAA